MSAEPVARVFLVTSARTHGRNRVTTLHTTRVPAESADDARRVVQAMHAEHEQTDTHVVDVVEDLAEHEQHEHEQHDRSTHRRRERARGASVEEIGPIDD